MAAKVDLVVIDNARINDVCDNYFRWKSLNDSLRSFCSRGINMPDAISEPMACYCLGLLWNKGSAGDAYNENGDFKYEFKATSNYDVDLSSFGPVCDFDDLVFLRFDTQDNLLYVYDTGINADDLKLLPVNQNETIGDHQRQKRRPHLSLINTVINPRGLQPTCIFNIRRCEIIRP